ncbi:unnamed protein product [Echinostoma caproni]|uniref:Uncharacterized protein n=1 Tax=Echinostoma caproni TaxID=27848 RepID=A0A183A1R6_9TREM|nr:unnamed protein product [Echinostoma caproni]
MDQKHSTRLGNISRSGQLIPGSKYYLGDSSAHHRSMRRQSESGAWDLKSESKSCSSLLIDFRSKNMSACAHFYPSR